MEHSIYLQPLLPNPVGENLRYDTVYDQIRQARREDNPRLSRGVWVFPLKQANWEEVEKYAASALEERTKDFQIAAWLVESWGMLHGFAGLARGFRFLTDFLRAFGETMYPVVVEGDQEHRLQICDWMDEAFARVLILTPLTKSKTPVTFADWMAASRLDAIARRSNNPDDVLAAAVERKDITVADFNGQMRQTETDFIQERADALAEIAVAFETFRQAINDCTHSQAPTFKTISARLIEVTRLLNGVLQERPKPVVEVIVEEVVEEEEAPVIEEVVEVIEETPPQAPPPPQKPPQKPKTLQDLYQELGLLADAFAEQDPHGPIPGLLRRLVHWEGKSVTDVLHEYSQTPEQMAALVKLMSR